MKTPTEKPTIVIFKMEGDKGDKSPVAFFPTLPGDNDPYTCTAYARVGQHCSASKAYYLDLESAKPEQFAPLKTELESLGYILDVRNRWTPTHDTRRINALDRVA